MQPPPKILEEGARRERDAAPPSPLPEQPLGRPVPPMRTAPPAPAAHRTKSGLFGEDLWVLLTWQCPGVTHAPQPP